MYLKVNKKYLNFVEVCLEEHYYNFLDVALPDRHCYNWRTYVVWLGEFPYIVIV